MRSDPLGIIRGLCEVVTSIYGPALTYAFPDPLVTARRHSVVFVSLISILDGTALNWCKQENLRAQMSEAVLFGKAKDSELIVLNFRGQLQCRMGEKRQGHIKDYLKFWNLNLLAKNTIEILRIPAWKKSFDFLKKELETILERDVLPTTISQIPTVMRMTLEKKHPDVGSVDTGPRSCGTAAETVHTSLGLLIHWVLGGSIFSYVRGRAKFMDHPGQEDDGLDKKMRGSIVRLARMSHHSYQLLLKMLGAVPAPKVEYLSDIWEKNSWVWKWRTLVIPKSKKRLTRRSSTHKLSIRMM